jgi:hypothetical protein
MHAFSGIRTHGPSVGASEGKCLRPRGHCDRLLTSRKIYFCCNLHFTVKSLVCFPATDEHWQCTDIYFHLFVQLIA